VVIGVLGAEELLKDEDEQRWVNANATVADGDDGLVAFNAPRDVNAPAVRRVLDRVENHVAERLHQARLVAGDGRQVAQAARHDHQSALAHSVGQRLQRAAHNRLKAQRGEVQAQRVHVKLADIEHSRDQFLQAVGSAADAGRHARDLVLVEQPLVVHGLHDLRVAANLGKRRAQFVAGDSDEVRLDAVQLLDLLRRGRQSAVERHLFGFAAAQVGNQAGAAQGRAALVGDGHQQFEVIAAEGIVADFRAATDNADQPVVHDHRRVGTHARLGEKLALGQGHGSEVWAEVQIVLQQGRAGAQQSLAEGTVCRDPAAYLRDFIQAWYRLDLQIVLPVMSHQQEPAAPDAQQIAQGAQGDLNQFVEFDHAAHVSRELAQLARGERAPFAQRPGQRALDQGVNGRDERGSSQSQRRQQSQPSRRRRVNASGQQRHAERRQSCHQRQQAGGGRQAHGAANVEDAVGGRAIRRAREAG